MKKTSSLTNAKRKVAFAEAQLRIAKRKLAESKRLNEDVNGYTFKDLFGEDFDSALKNFLKDSAEFIQDEIDGGEDFDTAFELSVDNAHEAAEESGDASDFVREAFATALFNADKIDSIDDFNKMLKAFGLEEIESDEGDEE